MSKTKKAKMKLTAPATRAEAEEMVLQIAAELNLRRKMQAELDEELMEVREGFAWGMTACDERVAVFTERVKLWAQANPQEFAAAKSIQFPAGVVGFRTGMPKLALLNRKWNWEQALEAMQRLMPKFIRQKPEIAADAILAEREEPAMQLALPGVGLKIVQGETFFVDTNLGKTPTRLTAKSAEPISMGAKKEAA